ncbi:MAG: 6-phosphogluconolactonase [Planctomycetota bacterium]
MSPEMTIRIFASARGVMDWAARTLVEVAASAEGRPVCVALSGGSTPERLYRMLAEERESEVPWDRLEVFFGDERAVPPEHVESNYRLAFDNLLSRVPVRAERVHRIRAEERDLSRAAREYEEIVRSRVPAGPDGLPSFDLVWLGIGSDGHTASLFPGSPALREERRLVAETIDPRTGAPRVTFTLPLLNAARRVQFLVVGESKSEIAKTILGPGRAGGEEPPAARVSPAAGDLEWLLDRAAASGIQDPGLIAGS